MNSYLVERPHDSVLVQILQRKDTGKYSFVNITKGHICTCQFDSVEDAVYDMDTRIQTGKVISYKKVKNNIFPRI